jgi:hypothetical protein
MPLLPRALAVAAVVPVACGAVAAPISDASAAASAPGAAPTPNPLIAQARLVGQFLLAGRVTAAVRIPGEHRGQTVSRTWVFSPVCRSGPCAQITLTRQRGRSFDRLALSQTAPGSYSGQGSFYAPLRCGGTTFAKGVRVPYTITVTITAAAASDFGVLATRVNATYLNRRRINLTRCVGVLGHDAANYHGHIVPATAADRLSGRSPAGS